MERKKCGGMGRNWEGGGEGYRMSPSEIQCDGDIKIQSIGMLESLGLWLQGLDIFN